MELHILTTNQMSSRCRGMIREKRLNGITYGTIQQSLILIRDEADKVCNMLHVHINIIHG